MKTKWFMLILFLSSIVLAEGFGNNDEKIKCVVSGDEIDKEESSNYREGMIYFCCGGCKMDFDESPQKFSESANFQLVATGQYEQTGCPVTGKSPGHSHHTKKDLKKVEVKGLSVDLCCAGCLKKVNKSKDKFSMLFSDKAYDKGFSKKEVKTKEKSANSKNTKK